MENKKSIVIGYKRIGQRLEGEGIVYYPGEEADCFFVPDEDVLLVRAWYTESKIMAYTIIDDPNHGSFLYEGREIAKGEHPQGPGLTISNIRRFEYETSKLRQLIKQAKLKKKLETEVSNGIEKLLK